MNIMLAVTSLKYCNGGVSTHLVDLSKAYSEMGHKVILLADGSDYREEIASIPNVIYKDINFDRNDKSPKVFMQCYKEMKRLCIEHKIEVLHVHGQRIIPLAQIIKSKLNIPYVWTNHTDAIPREKILLGMYKRWKFPIISVSQDMADYIISRGFKEKDITIVNAAINPEKFKPLTDEEKVVCREKFAVKDNQYVICLLSRINVGKGQDRLVRAVHKLQEKYKDQSFKVLLAGAGNMDYLEKDVLGFCRENGLDCTYCGFPEQREVFGVSNLFVLPSMQEGFALVCIEAVCAGCPAVRSETPGWRAMKDFVLHYDKNSEEELFNTIEYAYTHQEEMLSTLALGQKTVDEEFSTMSQSKKILDVYKRIIGK